MRAKLKKQMKNVFRVINPLTYKSRGKAFFKKITKYIRTLSKTIYEKILDLFSDNYYGTRLFKTSAISLGYALLTVLLYAGLLFVPASYVKAFSYIDFTQQTPVLLTVLLTILLSAGFVFLGDDTKGWSLARLTIIKHVVKLRELMLASVFICLVSITPSYKFGDYSLKTLLSPLLIVAFLSIAGIFIRVYRWLSDLAADPSLFEDKEHNESRLFASSSYRFARIVYLIRYTNQRDAWQAILERKIPDGYEELIHEEFFQSAEKIVKNHKIDMLLDLSLRLEIYDKYYTRRNLDSWRFYFDYTKRFLLLYSDIYVIAEERTVDTRTAMMWRGRSALENILKRLFQGSLSKDHAWNLFESMDSYIAKSNLNELPAKRGLKENPVLSSFVDELLETFYEDKIGLYDTASYMHDKTYWQVTYANLYEHKYNVSFVVLKHFEEWLFAKLDKESDRDNLYNIDGALQTLFPEVDPIDMASLYWFMYTAKNTNDSQFIIDSIYNKPRPFGGLGRTYGYSVTKSEEEHMKEFAAFQNEQREQAIKLFANIHAGYFKSGYWKINELIEKGEAKLIGKDKDDRGAMRIGSLVRDLRAIKKIYDNTANQIKKK